MVLATSFECSVILIHVQFYVLSKLSKPMWQLHVNVALVYCPGTCFAPLIIRRMLSILPHPLHPLSSTAKSRLKNLRGACVDAGETLRSFRSGFARTLAFFNSPLPEADVMPVLCRLVFLYNGTILPAKTG